MNITVISPAYYNSLDPVRYLAKSAEEHKVPVWWYGLGKPYPGWYGVQITDLLTEIPKIPTSHILYTDGSDTLMMAGLEEVQLKYDWANQPPILISRERSGVNAGGWLAEKDAILDALARLRDFVPEDPDYNNPQVRWRLGLEALKVKARVDERSLIFQVVDEELVVINGRVWNPRTQSYPTILHFAGGYTAPDVGKAAMIDPWLEKLGGSK